MVELRVPSPVLTNLEAAGWLRLDEDHDAEVDRIRALYRLVREHGLRPVQGLKPYRFTVTELERFACHQTGPSEPGFDGHLNGYPRGEGGAP